MMDASTLAVAALAVSLAYFVRGITGFGSALVAVPIIAHVLPLPVIVPFILISDFMTSLLLGGMDRKLIRWRELLPLVPAGLTGVTLGVTLLIHLPAPWLLAGLGCFVVAFGLRSIFITQGTKPISRLWAVPSGLMAGSVGAMFGTGGPFYIIYLSHRLGDKRLLRATFSGLFLIDGGSRILAFAATGLFTDIRTFILIGLGLPLMALGLHFGHKAHLKLTSEQMTKGVGMLLVASGGSLLIKAANLI